MIQILKIYKNIKTIAKSETIDIHWVTAGTVTINSTERFYGAISPYPGITN